MAQANVLDGKADTFWQTQRQGVVLGHPHWLAVDMGVATSVGGFRYLPRQDAADGRIKDYRFYVSADGANWGSPVAKGSFDSGAGEKNVAIPETWAPAVSTPDAQSSLVGETVGLAIQAVDYDGDPLTYSAVGLPPGLAIDNAGVIGGTIVNAVGSIGVYRVTVTVRDNRAFAGSTAFDWTVQAAPLALDGIVSEPQPVDTAVNYAASSSNGINPRYKWQFGDGSAETAYSSNPSSSHVFAAPGIYVVRLTATDDRGVEQSVTFVQAIHLPLTVGKPMASTSIAYEQQAGGQLQQAASKQAASLLASSRLAATAGCGWSTATTTRSRCLMRPPTPSWPRSRWGRPRAAWPWDRQAVRRRARCG